jgi:Dyp-type peroxidase family
VSPSTALPAGIEPDEALTQEALENIQGNIFAGFNKDHAVFLFLQFTDGDRRHKWLNELIEDDPPRIATTEQVATFNREFSEARRNRGGDDPEDLKAKWTNLGLTHAGLLALSPGLKDDLQPFAAFREGPAFRAESLRDEGLSAPDKWVFGADNLPPVHAVLTLAADDPSDLQNELDRVRAEAARHGLVIVYEQAGQTLPGQRKGHEHFGFKDGISQPGIIGFHERDPRSHEDRKGHPGTEMIQPGEFVLGLPRHGEDDTPRPHPEWMAFGSFQVIRRLRQDVPGWWGQVTRVRLTLPEDDPMAEDLLAAKLVGRWRSGTPLARAPSRDNRSAHSAERDNEFNFDEDRRGLITPRFAHIRKMYPRDDKRFGDDRLRIIRRGIPFGRTFDPTAGRGHGVDAERGLLFVAYMTSIEEQFEHLQREFANNPRFPSDKFEDPLPDGPDPVIGEDEAKVRLCREGREDAALDFRRFVYTTGATYAFAPSLATIRRLANRTL